MLSLNSSDTLDRVRYESITEKSEAQPNYSIKTIPDKTNSANTIEDSDIEMTENVFVSNLVMIDEAVTKAFEKAMCDGSNISLTGQFGAVSYPAYMVSDKFRAVIKNNIDEQYIWQSATGRALAVQRDTEIVQRRGQARHKDRLLPEGGPI